MARSFTPSLRWSELRQNYELSIAGHTIQHVGADEKADLLEFLEMHTSFSFDGREGHISVIKEKRHRGTGYWYAYRSSGRRTVRRYLGRSGNITITHLEEVAAALTAMLHDNPGIQSIGKQQVSSRSPISLPLPKLQPPRLPPSLVERPRLLQQLDTALQRKITLLVAPPGFGKTTSIIQWLHQQKEGFPFAWVSLDNTDNDLFHFWNAVIMACQKLQPDLGHTALSYLAEASQSPFAAPPLEMILTFFLNDLTQYVQNGLLVLDDYHVIKEPAIHETLTFFLEHLPAALNVLLTTRAEPQQLPLLRWHAKGDLSKLQSADLRFSLEETQLFLCQTLPTPISDAALKQLDASMQGWIAGLRLLTLARPEPGAAFVLEHTLTSQDQASFLSSPYQSILDYFLTEILKTQPAHIQRFLLQISVLSHLNDSLCSVVTGEMESKALLDAIERAGLFLETLDGGWYRFHALFAEALRREARACLGDEMLQALSLCASHWYEQFARLEEAIEAALQARAFERAILLIERIRDNGFAVELHTWHLWLSPIPKDTLRAHPMLCWMAALALHEEGSEPAAEKHQVAELLEMAEVGWQQQGNSASLGLIPAFHGMSAWKAGHFPQAAEYAQQALTILIKDEQNGATQIWRAICLFIVGIDALNRGDVDAAQSFFLQAYTHSLAYNYRHFTLSTLLLVGTCNHILGKLHQAYEHYQQTLSAARKQGDRIITAQALLSMANISFEWNKLAQAEQQTNEALALTSEDETRMRNDGALQLALLAHARGHISAAQQQLAVLQARLQLATTPELLQRLPNVLFSSARLSLQAGDLQTTRHIIQAPDLREETEASILQARISLAENSPREALILLEDLLPTTHEWHHIIEIRILLALACVACQDHQQARQWLQQALSQARTEGLIRIFLAEGDQLARLLRQLIPALHERDLRSYAQSIMRAFALSGETYDDDHSTDKQLFETLSAQEQRVLRLLAAGNGNQEIAQELVISINTVKDHIKHLYSKLGVSNRVQACEAARHLQLL